MENSIESLIAAQIQRTSEKCENPYILSTDLAMLNDSIANMTNALANYLAMKNNDEVIDNELGWVVYINVSCVCSIGGVL